MQMRRVMQCVDILLLYLVSSVLTVLRDLKLRVPDGKSDAFCQNEGQE